jgi:hypothetical protein
MRLRQLDKWMNGWMPARSRFIPSSLNPFIRILACAGAIALVAGCAGYRLGPTNGVVAGEKRIQITPFLNHTFEPRLGDALTTALRHNIQRDGTYHLATQGDADIVVTGVLNKYTRHALNFEPHDVLTVRDFRVSVVAQFSARDVFTGATKHWTNTVYTLVRVGSDLTSAERQAMPVLADELARSVTDSLVDGSW